MHENTETTLTRDCEAIRIPSGDAFTIPAGTRILITQALGGSFTIATDQGLARITDANADALGIEQAKAEAPAADQDGIKWTSRPCGINCAPATIRRFP